MKGFHILVLEDEIVTSVALAKALQAELPEAHIHRASTLFEARLLLSTFEFQFFLIDVNLPDGNGIDFVLDASARNPDAGAVIMTADPLPKYRDRASSFGALHFFEKPVAARALGQLIRTHRAAAAGVGTGPDTSFTASLTRLTVMDVIQLKCLSQASLRLDFTLKDGRGGSIYLQEGNITHAEALSDPKAAPVSGIPALAQILSWRGGKIVEVKGVEPPATTIQGGWQGLLLHAAQMADEGRPPTDAQASALS